MLAILFLQNISKKWCPRRLGRGQQRVFSLFTMPRRHSFLILRILVFLFCWLCFSFSFIGFVWLDRGENQYRRCCWDFGLITPGDTMDWNARCLWVRRRQTDDTKEVQNPRQREEEMMERPCQPRIKKIENKQHLEYGETSSTQQLDQKWSNDRTRWGRGLRRSARCPCFGLFPLWRFQGQKDSGHNFLFVTSIFISFVASYCLLFCSLCWLLLSTSFAFPHFFQSLFPVDCILLHSVSRSSPRTA